MSEQSKNVAAMYDFELICAGVLRTINDVKLVEKYKDIIDPEYFFYGDSSLRMRAFRKLLKEIIRHAETYGSNLVSQLSIESKILSATLKSEENDEMCALWDLMKSSESIRKKSTDDGCFALFMDYLKVTHLLKWSKPFQSEYRQGNVAAAIESMRDVIPILDKIKPDEDYSLDIEKLEEWLAENNSDGVGAFYLGCSPLDHAIGGFEPQTLNVLITLTNGGKSMFAQHILRMCVQQKKTAHITFVEDRPRSAVMRMVASLTGIPIRRLKHDFNQLTVDERAMIAGAKVAIRNFIKADFVYGESIESVQKRKLDYDAERKSKGLQPYEIDIVDYTSHIAGSSFGDKKYEKIHTAYSSRKNFALKHNKVCFDFAQINREGNKKSFGEEKPLTHEDLAGSYDMAQVCDTIISINRYPKLRDSNQAILHVCKGRDGEVGGEFLVGTDFARARWDMASAKWLNPSGGQLAATQAMSEVQNGTAL